MTDDRSIPEPMPEMPRLGLDDIFHFRCDAAGDCFTQCCRDVSILLTPYDVLRMKRALGISSSEFLDRYTLTMQSEDKKAPVVFLRMDPETTKCQLVGPGGCSVYQDRPWACRMYPLGMAEPETADAAARRVYFVVKEDLCHGHEVGPGCTVRSWLSGQGIESYEQMQQAFHSLMYHPGWDDAANVTPKKMSMFFMACYDLDTFRRFVFESRFLEFFDIDDTRVEALRTDDEELLEFAVDWLLFTLFHEPRMKIRKQVSAEYQARSAPVDRQPALE